MRLITVALFVLSGLAIGSRAGADPAEVPSAPQDRPASSGELRAGELLGGVFEHQSAGISLRIPLGLHKIASTGVGDDLGQWGDEKRSWQLKLTRSMRPQPASLTSGVDGFGKPVPGMLDQTVEHLKIELPACKVLRQDLTNIRDGDPKVLNNAAMIAVRYTASARHFLSQQAIIQANDRIFYLLTLTTPGSDAKSDEAPDDTNERVAVETFRQMLDSVRLLDTEKIVYEQRDRLMRTRALLVNWGRSRLHGAIVPEQWLRVLKDGKDIGYSYITEQAAAGVPRALRPEELRAGKGDRDLVQPGDGILVGVRARSLETPPQLPGSDKPRGPVQVDSASWLFVSPDRKLEDWSRITLIGDGTVDKDGRPIKTHVEEFGASSQQVTRSLDKDALPGTKSDPKQPAVRIHEQYTLDVTTITGSGGAEPLTQQLPPWYLPQALGHMLPRLLPLEQPKSYLFATYVPDAREVMLRYVEVGREQRLTFNGKIQDAIPITDRLGWHASVTTHYMSPAGKYLGSESKDAHVMMLPTDAQTLMSIWKNPNLTPPAGTERPHAPAAAGSAAVPSLADGAQSAGETQPR